MARIRALFVPLTYTVRLLLEIKAPCKNTSSILSCLKLQQYGFKKLNALHFTHKSENIILIDFFCPIKFWYLCTLVFLWWKHLWGVSVDLQVFFSHQTCGGDGGGKSVAALHCWPTLHPFFFILLPRVSLSVLICQKSVRFEPGAIYLGGKSHSQMIFASFKTWHFKNSFDILLTHF